jgi:TrmH family RNA methyltransferase
MLSKNRLRDLSQLHQKKHREQDELFLAEGAKIVPELLHSNFPVNEIFALQNWVNLNQALLSKRSIPVSVITQQDLERLSQLQNPQEVIALCSKPKVEQVKLNKGALYLFLDSIRDPGNMGTIMRLADWFGIDAVYASDDCVEWANPKVIQASMGSFIRMRPQYVESVGFLKETSLRCPVYATDLEGENIYSSSFKPEGMLIISNEAHGLNPALENWVSQKIHIPAAPKEGGMAESLNAAIAAAVVLGEFYRQRML